MHVALSRILKLEVLFRRLFPIDRKHLLALPRYIKAGLSVSKLDNVLLAMAVAAAFDPKAGKSVALTQPLHVYDFVSRKLPT